MVTARTVPESRLMQEEKIFRYDFKENFVFSAMFQAMPTVASVAEPMTLFTALAFQPN